MTREEADDREECLGTGACGGRQRARRGPGRGRAAGLAVVAAWSSLLGAPSIARADVVSVALSSTLSVGSLNWPDALWYVRAVERDAGAAPVGAVTSEIDFVLASEWPSIEVIVTTTAPSDHQILFLRANQSMRIGDSVEGYVLTCGSSAVCDDATPSSIALSNTLPWVVMSVPGLFGDGFELGDLSAWSSSVGGP